MMLLTLVVVQCRWFIDPCAGRHLISETLVWCSRGVADMNIARRRRLISVSFQEN